MRPFIPTRVVPPPKMAPWKRGPCAPDSSQSETNKGKVRVFCGGPSVGPGLGCGHASDWYRITSPAAPTVALMTDELSKLGWTDDAGSFASMALGLSVLCPMCSRNARDAARKKTKKPA